MSFQGKQLSEVTIDGSTKEVVDWSLGRTNLKAREISPGRKKLPFALKTLDVRAYTYHLNSEATSLAMILGYWDKNGFEKFRPEPETKEKEQDDAGFISSLVKGCGGCGDTTTVEVYGASLGYVVKTRYSSLPSEKPQLLASFAAYKKQIDQGRPVKVKISSAASLTHW